MSLQQIRILILIVTLVIGAILILMSSLDLWRYVLPKKKETNTSTSTVKDEKKSDKEQSKTPWLKILIGIVVVAGLVYFLFFSDSLADIRATEMLAWIDRRVVGIVVLSAILYGLSFVPALKTFKPLLSGAAKAILIFCVGVWLWVCIASFLTDDAKHPPCSEYTPDAVRECVLTEEWSKPITADRPTNADEYQFCYYVPSADNLLQENVGPNTFRYRTKHGDMPIWYQMMKVCPTKKWF